MSDFLKNLRSSNKQDSSKPRKNLAGNYYPQNNRRNYTDRRLNIPNEESLLQSIKEILLQLVDTSSNFVDHFEKMLEQNDPLFQAKIRQYNSTSLFFDNLNKMINNDLSKRSGGGKSKVTTSYTSGTHYTKDEIFNIIGSMRKQGATFSIIAEYLKEKGIPTFSGRGEWHAQTIHRLCK